MTLVDLVQAGTAIRFTDLGLSPIALDLGFLKLRWYSLAYLAGIIIGWWYLTRLLRQPGAPMSRQHADDLVFYATLGIIIGGRLGYVTFYRPEMWLSPRDVVKLWEGGMSFHGGAIGLALAVLYLAWRNRLQFLRLIDYIACVVPFGIFFGRLANFVNGELYGRPTEMPWGIIFPATGDDIPRHPSQLYEAGLEGLVLFAILWFAFWRTDARYRPGMLAGLCALFYGIFRFIVELFRQPDAGLENLSWGLTMGQTLTLPMIVLGLWLIATAKGRRQRVEPVAGSQSVA